MSPGLNMWKTEAEFYFAQRAALENMTKILKGAGTSLENVVKVNIYLTNLDRDFAPMNEVYTQVLISIVRVVEFVLILSLT